MEKISTNNMKKYFGVNFQDFKKYNKFILGYGQDITKYGTRFYKPSQNKKNIICCGCSMTWGSEVEYNESYPYLLNEIINKNNQNYQVLNMGYPGAGLQCSIEWFKFLTQNINPHMCILQPPDIFRQPFPILQEDHIIFHSYNYGTGSLIRLGYLNMFNVLKKIDFLIKSQLKKFINFIKFLKVNNIIPVILIICLKGGFPSQKIIRNQYLNLIMKYLKKENIKTIDFDSKGLFKDKNMKSRFIMPGGHYSRAGNLKLSKRLAKDIFDINNRFDFKFIK